MTRKWWHEKVAYQIYPKSFYDTNNDGIGDLQGIIQKLDYLKELNVDIVWLSPIYCSPLADQGYDISDYYNIDPVFGTMDDMDSLIAEAKKRDMHIVMDLVVNHCSDEHEWFKKACIDPDGEYGKFFYIRDWKKGTPLPCNWRGYFGGPVWDLLPGHEDKIYLHLFHKKQPDLNWENPKMRQEIYKMINWWLDKGLAGFRLDAIINIKKALPFSNYPADRADGLCSIVRMLEQAHGVGDFLNEMADETFRKHDAFTVGEVFNEKPEEFPLFIGENGYFSSMFDFAEIILGSSEKGWYDHHLVTPYQYRDAAFASQRKSMHVGFLSNLIENHDEPRGVSRFIPAEDLSETSKKMLGGLNFMLRGLPFIYQGQEIGMENFQYNNVDEIDDVSAWDEYRVALEAGLSEHEALQAVNAFSRDNARSPFQWDSSKNAGFSSAKPWLGINPNYTYINLEEQKNRPDSLWNFYRSLIELRKNPEYKETVVYGETIPYLEAQPNLMAYYRKADRNLLVIGNFQKENTDVILSEPAKNILINNMNSVDITNNVLHMQGYQFIVIEL